MGNVRKISAIVIITASAEWKAVRAHWSDARIETDGPYPWFRLGNVVLVHSGCGKIPSAAATQYSISRWKPAWITHAGSCGALDGAGLGLGDCVAATKTVVYDLNERSGGQAEMIRRFTTRMPLLASVQRDSSIHRGVVVTGDQDLDTSRVDELRRTYDALAADWEAGAIAYVARKVNDLPCLILKVVSDEVKRSGSSIYVDSGKKTDLGEYERQVRLLVPPLVERLLSCVPAEDR